MVSKSLPLYLHKYRHESNAPVWRKHWNSIAGSFRHYYGLSLKVLLSKFYDWQNKRTVYPMKLGPHNAALILYDTDTIVLNHHLWLLTKGRLIAHRWLLRMEYGA